MVTVDYPSSMAFSDYSDLYPSAVSFSKLPQFRDDLATFHSDCSFPAKSREGEKRERKRSSAAPTENAPPGREGKTFMFELMKIMLEKRRRPRTIDGLCGGGYFAPESARLGGWTNIGIYSHCSELWYNIQGNNWCVMD